MTASPPDRTAYARRVLIEHRPVLIVAVRIIDACVRVERGDCIFERSADQVLCASSRCVGLPGTKDMLWHDANTLLELIASNLAGNCVSSGDGTPG